MFDDLLAQVGLLTPWILLPVAAGVVRVAIRSPAGSPERFLLWLAAPPLVVFAVVPLLGQSVIPHWFDSGWLFAFPLAGAWLADRSPVFQKRSAARRRNAVFILIHHPPGGARCVNPTAVPAPSSRLSTTTGPGAGSALRLAPTSPSASMGDSPRGFAFTCDLRAHLGRDALVVRHASQRRRRRGARLFPRPGRRWKT